MSSVATTAPLISQVTPSEMKTFLETHLESKWSAFIWGPPGVGKSSIIAQFAADHGYELIDIRLSQFDNTDIRGIPFKHADGMKWELPSMFPRDPKAKAIILLDEFAQAEQSVRKAAFQLVLDRRIGDYIVPDNVKIVAASNRTQDRSGASKIEYALKSRFVHYDLCVSFEDFINWAIDSNFNPKMLGYLSNNKNMLHNFDPASESNGGMSPRQWEMASDMWNASEDLPRRLRFVQLEGCVGKTASEGFKSHMDLEDKLPEINSIFSGTAAPIDKGSVAIGFSVGYSLLYAYRDMQTKIDTADTPLTPAEEEAHWKKINNMFAYMDGNINIVILSSLMKSMNDKFGLRPKFAKTPASMVIIKRVGKDLAYISPVGE
jgi:hypothetical protein